MSDQVKIPLPRSLQEIVGSLLFASQDPLTATELRDAVRAVEPEEGENAEVMDVYKTCTSREIDEAIKGLGKALEVAGCGFRLVCTGGTYRLQTEPSCGRYVRAMLKLDRPSRLGRASLETLAIIAYRQPITKSEIEAIRGVDVSANIKTLMDLQLIPPDILSSTAPRRSSSTTSGLLISSSSTSSTRRCRGRTRVSRPNNTSASRRRPSLRRPQKKPTKRPQRPRRNPPPRRRLPQTLSPSRKSRQADGRGR